MIKVTRLNGSELFINADMIETLESTPDTVLTLTSDDKWVIRESPEDVIERIISYKNRIRDERPRQIKPEN